MRTLAIDLGTKRVGLALSDEGGRFATPYDVLTVASSGHAIERIARIVEDESVQRIVVGLPINMDDTLGPAARSTIAWAHQLSNAAVKEGSGPIVIVFVDERLSSFAAEQELNDRKRAGEKLTRKRRKEQLDAVAAAGFLQAFLDGKLMPIDPTG